MSQVITTDLKDGMILAEPVYNRFKLKLFDTGVRLDFHKIEVLLRWGIKQVRITDEIDAHITNASKKGAKLIREPGEKRIERDIIGGVIQDNKDMVIAGNVRNGKVYVAGNLLVEGDVEGSEIKSTNGNIEVRGAILNSIISAAESVTIVHGMNLKVECGQTFILQEYAENITVQGGLSVLLPANGIYTGKISGVEHLIAQNIGARYGQVELDFQIMDFEKYAEIIFKHRIYLKDLINRYKGRMQILQTSINIVKLLGQRIKLLDDERKNTLLTRTRDYLRAGKIVSIINEELYTIDKQLNSQERIYMKVIENMHGNILLTIGNRKLEIKQDFKEVEVYFKGIIRII